MGRFLDRIKNGLDGLPEAASSWLKRSASDALSKVDVPEVAIGILKRIGGDNVAVDVAELAAWSMMEAEQLAAARPATNWTGKKKRKIAAALLVFELVEENLLPPRLSDAAAEELLQAIVDAAQAHEIGGHLKPPTPDEGVPVRASGRSRKGAPPPPTD